MHSQTTCTDCGIRFSATLTACPWCGAVAPEPVVLEPEAVAPATRPDEVEARRPEIAAGPEPAAEPEPAPPEAATTMPLLEVGPAEPEPLAPRAPRLEVGPAEAREHDDMAVPGLEVGPAERGPAAPPVPFREVGPAEFDEDLAVPGLHTEPGAPEPAPRGAAPPIFEVGPAEFGEPLEDGKHVMASMEEAPPAAPRQPPPPRAVVPPPAGTPVELIPPGAPEAPERQAPPEPGESGPPRRRSRARAWLINGAFIIGLLVIGALIAEFAPIGRSGETTATTPGTVALPTTTPPVATTLPPATTVPPATTTSTTQATTTTTEPPTTTTATTLPPIDPIGDPIAIDDLRMGVDGLGPLAFGSDGAEVVGRLVASLGQPTADSGVFTSAGELGSCVDEPVRIVQFGSLSVVNQVGDDGGETFAAYRLLVDPDSPVYPADSLQTISGIGAGDTVGRLKLTYASLVIELTQSDQGATFELRRSSDEGLLLWGPISAVDDTGVIQGVYSPDVCSA